MLAWLVIAAALAGPDASAIKADLDAWDAKLAEHDSYTFSFTEKEAAQLANGEVVKRRNRLDGPDRVMGAVWADVTLREMWSSNQDDLHWGHVSGLIDEELPGSTHRKKLLYQRIEAPWPFKDRQWVILIENDVPLFEASGRKAIARTWDLSDERGAKNEADDGLWVPVNDGGWFVAPVAGGTILVYHVRAVIGGNVPEEAASTWTMMTLGGMLRGLVESAEAVSGHYTGDHPPILWPDEEPIEKW